MGAATLLVVLGCSSAAPLAPRPMRPAFPRRAGQGESWLPWPTRVATGIRRVAGLVMDAPTREHVTLAEPAVVVRSSEEAMQLTCSWGGCHEDAHVCALLSSGRVRCWGGAGVGQRGDGTREGATEPSRVAGIDSAVDIALGTHHTCALLRDGEVWCWGYDVQGQLGDGADHSVATRPVRAAGVHDAVAIDAGDYHSCALSRAGLLLCWGAEAAFGIETPADALPVALPVAGRRLVAIAVGGHYTCALDADGDLWCGGDL